MTVIRRLCSQALDAVWETYEILFACALTFLASTTRSAPSPLRWWADSRHSSPSFRLFQKITILSVLTLDWTSLTSCGVEARLLKRFNEVKTSDVYNRSEILISLRYPLSIYGILLALTFGVRLVIYFSIFSFIFRFSLKVKFKSFFESALCKFLRIFATWFIKYSVSNGEIIWSSLVIFLLYSSE
jgi:hypothetical protein